MKKLLIALMTSVFAFFSVAVMAADAPSNKKKLTKLGLYLTPTEANEMKTKGGDKVLFVDIRTQAEQEFVGQPTNIDMNIPWEFRDFTKYDEKKKRHAKALNKNFVAEVEALAKSKGLGKNDSIIFICRSGFRSGKAADAMADKGYKKVYSVTTGVQGGKNKADHKKRNKEGWIHDNLPWTWKLIPEKMYFKANAL